MGFGSWYDENINTNISQISCTVCSRGSIIIFNEFCCHTKLISCKRTIWIHFESIYWINTPVTLATLYFQLPFFIFLIFPFLRVSFFSVSQCRWKFRGNTCHESHSELYGPCGVATASHLQKLMRNRRWVLSIRRANVCDEIWKLDIRWFSGKIN